MKNPALLKYRLKLKVASIEHLKKRLETQKKQLAKILIEIDTNTFKETITPLVEYRKLKAVAGL